MMIFYVFNLMIFFSVNCFGMYIAVIRLDHVRWKSPVLITLGMVFSDTMFMVLVVGGVIMLERSGFCWDIRQ